MTDFDLKKIFPISSSRILIIHAPMILVDIVTGASQGIGRAIAESIASHRSLELASSNTAARNNYALVLTGRNVDRGQAAADQVAKAASLDSSNNVHFEPCDLSDYGSVLSFQSRISQLLGTDDYQVGVLVNDAAECPKRQEMVSRPCTESGEMVQVDKQFATNVLGYHFMIKVFQDRFSDSVVSLEGTMAKPTHVLNVASNWAGDLDFSDLHFQRRSYDNDSAYRQSKQCDRILTKAWSDRLKDAALVNSCHPGDPCTTLSKALGYNLWSSAPTKQMIETEMTIPYLCRFRVTSSPLTTSGGWYEGGTKPRKCRFMSQDSQRLFDICESFSIPKADDLCTTD